MPALIFLPNMGACPVSSDTRVTVTLGNKALLEGRAGGFDWGHNGKEEVIEGWREMMPGEAMHPEHLPKNNSVHRSINHGE